MACQQAISTRRLRRKVGTRQQIIIDEVCGPASRAAHAASGAFAAKGRSKGDAPEIDGGVHVKGGRCARPGDVLRVVVEASDDHDLHARPARL